MLKTRHFKNTVTWEYQRDHAVAFVGVSTLIKPLPSSNIIGFPHEVRAQVEDSGVRPLQNSTMLPTHHCSPAYSGVLKINADPWLKPVSFLSTAFPKSCTCDLYLHPNGPNPVTWPLLVWLSSAYGIIKCSIPMKEWGADCSNW